MFKSSKAIILNSEFSLLSLSGEGGENRGKNGLLFL
jgi:hypothetical protein